MELSPASGEDGGLGQVSYEMGADGKARIERMCMSLLMSKNL